MLRQDVYLLPCSTLIGQSFQTFCHICKAFSYVQCTMPSECTIYIPSFFFLSLSVRACWCINFLVDLLLHSVLEKLQSSSKMHKLILFVKEIQMLEA